MSLLLTVGEQPISKICISKTLGGSFLPCKGGEYDNVVVGESYCEAQGKVPLMSVEATTQLQMLIFVLAAFHVLSCLLTLSLGMAKMKRWGYWEEETQTLEHSLSYDSRRIKLARETSFGKRHLDSWSDHRIFHWIVCSVRQFINSVSKPDYFALRRGFIMTHVSKDCKFDFNKFLSRALNEDFVIVVGISIWNWAFTVLFILCTANGFYSYFWLPFIPLVILVVVGAKMESIITTMCWESKRCTTAVKGSLLVKPHNDLFWFCQPQLLLHLIHFILFQNSFQLAFITWTWYRFGIQSCYHKETGEIIMGLTIGVSVQFLIGYVTLPLYALVSQMGSSMKETIFTENVSKALKNWHNTAKENLESKKLSQETSLSLMSSPPLRHETSYEDTEEFDEIRELKKSFRKTQGANVVESEMNDASTSFFDGEASFGVYIRKEPSFREVLER
ncbi:MLO-like protein 6 [Acorus gramineus]|uniref:MLO-like protein n=1 Tax=Acorus gramineus TaxID=55184 RepID=A0AAV9BKF5_ACOGR|nr:MLO-like protein 6 [Acorus gramineus]